MDWGNYQGTEEQKEEALNFYIEVKKFPSLVARKFKSKLPELAMVTLDDLEASARVALWKCLDRFDPSKGVKFETYAGRRMVGAMKDYMREVDWVGRRGREAQRAGANIPEMCYLEGLLGFDEQDSRVHAESEVLKSVVRHLDHFQRKILRLVFIEGHKIEQVASMLGMPSNKVSAARDQIISRAQSSVLALS